MEARNSRTFRSPPPPPAQKGATKTVQVDDLLASASNETPKKRKLFRRLCRCKMLSSKKKRKQFPRRVAIVTLTLIILCGIALAITWAAMDKVCDTPSCIVAAARAVSYMDQTVNPCDDFYEFACRGLKENSSSLREDYFNPLISTLNADYDRILTGETRLNNLSPKFKPLYNEIKRIHKSCMDRTLNDTYVPFEFLFPSSDIKRAIEEAQKFTSIFWNAEYLSKGILSPAPAWSFSGRPWKGIYDEYGANATYEQETVKFNDRELDIVFRHLANWTSVFSEIRPAQLPVTVINYPFFEAVNDYVASNPQGLYQNISQAVNSAVQLQSRYMQNQTQGSDEQPKLNYCRNLLLETYGDVISYLWYSQRYKSSQTTAAQKMKTNLQNIFNNRITENEWLDGASKDIVKQKLLAITFTIGEGSEPFSEDDFIRNNTISGNLSDIYKIQQMLATKIGVRTPPDLMKVNAAYYPQINRVIIPYTILQEPLLATEAPISMQYGSIGFIIGHEITHAIDSTGIFYSQNGTFNPQSIITAESINKFNDSAKCFVEKYSNYKEANTTVDGKRTLGENIADNGGLHSAWQAYQSEKAAKGLLQKRVRLPSLSYNDEQLFFISFAQTWCSAKSDAAIRKHILNEVHTPDKSRVNAGLSLFEPFAKTFNCPASSNMNPSKRCRMWKRGVPVS